MTYLLKPLQAGPLSLTNRLVMPPMATAKACRAILSNSKWAEQVITSLGK